VEHDEVRRPPEAGGSGGEAADEGNILAAFEKIAGRIVAPVDEQIGAADPGGKASGQREPFALGATVNMRGCGEIGGA
ncbi:MAG TPA: hypothetical protein DIC31_10430, partial [Rhizobiales bacterium]|nr:hypothetical protein [Hyphomicrobiales bacterium]